MTIMIDQAAPDHSVPAQRAHGADPPSSPSSPFTQPSRESEISRIKVADQHQVLEFDGRLIGFASTETSETTRWTEIEIFRTKAGNYVVHRVGASVVYHDPKAPCASGSLAQSDELLADGDDHQPCDRCRPLPLSRLPHGSRVRRETDRHSADAIRSPEELIRALSLRRPNGSSYLSAVARDALDDAADNDETIARLTNKTVVIP